MKTICTLTVMLLYACTVFSQTAGDYPQWQHPVLKGLKTNNQLVPFYQTGNTAFINLSVVDKKQNCIYWFDRYGYYFDAVPLNDNNMQAILSKKISPFTYYDLITTAYLETIIKARNNLQANGKAARFSPYERQLLRIDDSLNHNTTLKKLIELDRQKLSVERQIREFHSIDPVKIRQDSITGKTLSLPYGAMETSQGENAVTIYYNQVALSPVYKAVLDHKTSSICYYNRSGQLIDELQPGREKAGLILREKTDVFLLYRGWLEMERFAILANISEINRDMQQLNQSKAGINQYAAAQSTYQFLLEYAHQFLMVADYKISYTTTIDRSFVSQCLKEQYRQASPASGAEEGHISVFSRGNKRYELTDARGNVMTVITDRKMPHSSNGTVIDYYEPDILAAADYAPFGSPLSGRIYQPGNYRYGYNGKENDNEVKGQGNQVDYGERIYDPRLGRFLSTDPLTRSFPFYSPYQFAGNTPIQAIDLDGLEPEFIIDKQGKLTKPMIALFNAAFGYSTVEMQNTHWKKTNTSFNAQTIYHTIKYGSRTDLDKFDSEEMWTDFWLNLTVHENRHRTEYSGLGSWLKWSMSYMVMTAIEDSKEHDPKFYSHNTPAEKRAYGIEQPMVELMNFQNSLALKVLESNYDDNTKVGIMQYVGTSFNLQKAQERLKSLNTKQDNFDGPARQARKLERQIKRQEKVVNALSSEVDNLKTKYKKEIDELDKKQSREVKLVASPTK